jgi:hypothetical protein
VWFAAFIVMAYTALYYGFMVLPAYEKPVETLTDLLQSNQRWFAYVTTVMMTYAKYKPLGDKAIYRHANSFFLFFFSLFLSFI